MRVVVAGRLDVTLPQGTGQIPVATSQDWSRPLPGVTRAVIVIHGLLRNADVYLADAEKILPSAGTLLVVPQFLDDADIAAHGLPPGMLRWGLDTWSDGEPAHGPIPASAYDALDAALARLADPVLFPDLRMIVVAGHSAGAQTVQRYAVVVQGGAAVRHGGIHLRFVVANPSSYLYFGDDRPLPGGGFAPYSAASCPGFDRWKYGFAGGVPPYVSGTSATLEAAYAARDVIYLLGGNDTDPNHRLLDKTCGGEAEGPYRLARGKAFFAEMQARDGAALHHHLFVVPGVGHDAARMFGSACGLAALFDAGAVQYRDRDYPGRPLGLGLLSPLLSRGILGIIQGCRVI